MADQRGGYRAPSNPSPVPMPGAMSGRTDGGPADTQPMRSLPNAGYGEAANFDAIQGGAPMAGNATPMPEVVPIGADSRRPEEPVTAGMPFGEGVGPTAAGIDIRSPEKQDVDYWKHQLPLLEYMANQQGASPTTRALIRRIKGNL